MLGLKKMESTNSEYRFKSLHFLFILACYFGLHVLLRVTVSDSLDYDEAEQAMLGQWLLPGYTEQPPLYTWIQHYLFRIFGENVFSVSLLKNSLLYLTYVFVFFSSRIILKNNRAAILATCSLLLIPQIAWESQRDMTHTTLVVFAAAASLYQSLRLMEKRTCFNYLLFGLFLGIGFMAKANFGLFLIILFLTLVTFPQGRRVLFNWKILLSFAVLFGLAGNYFYWMFNNQDIVFSATKKFKRAVDNYYVKGSLSLIANSFLFLTPLWLFYLIFFPSGYDAKWWEERTFHQRFIARYIVFFFIVLLMVVLLFKVTYVKDRWLQPLLFVVPILFFSRVPVEKLTLARYKGFLTVIGIAATAVYLAFTIRVVGASYIDRFCRLNYPFSLMAEDIRANGFESGLIISDNRFLAGNMHFQFPTSPALVPEYHFENLPSTQGIQNGLVIWKADASQNIPEKLSLFLNQKYEINAEEQPIKYFEHTYKYGRTETVRLAVMSIPLNQP
ncbi:MAG: 4-amino-4-deoxy-L-arabinose transferase-like glycosyltransferase [Desulforhopalus sp.]